MTYIYIYMRKEQSTNKTMNPDSHNMRQGQDNAFPAPEDRMENVKRKVGPITSEGRRKTNGQRVEGEYSPFPLCFW